MSYNPETDISENELCEVCGRAPDNCVCAEAERIAEEEI